MLARDCARGIKLREVDIWGNPAFWINTSNNHLALFDCDALHYLLVLQNVQECVRLLRSLASLVQC